MPSSLLRVNALAVTIRPPLPKRAKAVNSTLHLARVAHIDGLTSTPSDGAADWMAPNMPIPAVIAGSRMTAARVTAGAISLRSSSHFPAMPYSN
jgi:hypothetical protein